jgi:ABC-type glycerol-3-phosphate transport system substrate-binding protein
MNSGYMPTRNAALAAIADFIADFDNYKVAIDAIDNVVTPTQFGTNALEANQYIMEAIEAVMLGAESAETALGNANQKLIDLLGN